MRRLDWRVPLLLMLIGLVGCSPNRSGLDSRLFSGGACKVPCWQGLTPGTSTSEDVDHFLQQLSKEDWPGRREYLTGGCKRIRLTGTDSTEVNALADLYIEGGKLTFVESTPPVGLGPTLRQVTDHFGPPEYFEAVKFVGLERDVNSLEVYYPSQGLAFQVHVGEGDATPIDPEMRVLRIDYFRPGDLISYFTDRYCLLGKAAALEQAKVDVENFVQPWSGFGEVKVVTEGPPGH